MSKADRRARKRENRLQGQAARAAEAKRRKQRSGLIRGSIIAVIVVVVFGIIIATGHKSNDKKAAAATTVASCSTVGGRINCAKAPAMSIDVSKKYTATIATAYGKIVIALDAKNAPIATNNFVFLARHHFYDGLKWHRVVKGFVIQGGDPKGDGSGGPGYTVKGEVPKNGYSIGSVAAAKGGTDPNGTMGSQFFIVVGSQGASLPSQYAKFGQVTSGQSVAAKIASFANGDGPPTHTIYIDKVTISES